jgi:SnoaL-like protein
MHDNRQIAETYLAAWNEDDDQARREMLGSAWAADARYVDPMMNGEGRDGIAEMIAAARTQFPGHRFTVRGTPDGYGDVVRFGWTLAPDNGAAVALGTDIVRLDDAGRIREVIGFLEAA